MPFQTGSESEIWNWISGHLDRSTNSGSHPMGYVASDPLNVKFNIFTRFPCMNIKLSPIYVNIENRISQMEEEEGLQFLVLQNLKNPDLILGTYQTEPRNE